MPGDLSVGLISGTGDEGRGIALRLARAGVAVALGSRSLDRAAEAAARLSDVVGQGRIIPLENHELIRRCEVLFLTVPFAHVADVLRCYASQFSSAQILVDVTVPVFFKNGPHLVTLTEPSGSEFVRSQISSKTPVVAAFKTLPAELLGEPHATLDCDEFLCSDSIEAKARILEIISRIPDLRWVDAGPLGAASILEHMTLLAIQMNRRYKVKGARFRLVGLP